LSKTKQQKISFYILHLRLCLVGVILGRMENERDKNGEKMMFF